MIKKIKQFTIEKVMQDDQNGVWVKAAHLGRTCWISLSLFGESDEYGYSKLRSLGVNILSLAAKTDAKNRLQEVVPNGTILVAQRPGYLFADKDVTKRPICYAYGSGDLIFPQKTKRPEIIVGFKPQKSFESRGDFPTFQKEMSILINGQPIPVLVLTMSLVPILQPFAPPEMYIENIILELCGRSSSGKSAVAVGLGGAVWGGNPRSKTGFFKTWNSTVNATEESLPRYQNALIGLDEATVASGNAKKRGEDISNFTHRL